MNLEKLLKKSLEERFLASTSVDAIEDKIKSLAKKLVIKKYEDSNITRGDMDYKFYGVSTDMYHNAHELDVNTVRVSLTYLCTSKLTKVKREKLAKAKASWDENNYAYDGSKYPVVIELRYDVEVKTLMGGEVFLILK